MAIVLTLLASFGGGIALADPNQTPPTTPTKSKTSIDQVEVIPGSPTIPLRNSGILPGSEVIELGGRRLTRDKEYVLDAARGVVFLSVSIPQANTLRATYQFDPDYKPTTGAANGTGLGSLTGLGLNMFGQGQKMFLGFGMANRLADGTIVQSNMMGMQTKFGFQGGGLNGVVAMGDQKKVRSAGLLDNNTGDSKVEEGKSHAIVQSLGLKALGGSIRADWQDISEKFSGIEALRSSGYKEDRVNALYKERGLRRTGVGFQDLSMGGLKISAGLDSVRNKDASIDWRSYGAKLGGLSVGYASQKASKDFGRFKDLSNSDRDQLAKEAGMTREEFDMAFSAKSANAKFTSDKLGSDTSAKLLRREMSLGLGGFSGNYFDRTIGQEFSRFDATRMSDAGQLAREKGMRRQGYGLGYTAAGGVAATFATQWMRSVDLESSRFDSTDFTFSSKNWNLKTGTIASGAGYNSLGALSDAEQWDILKRITQLTDRSSGGPEQHDRNQWLNSSGIHRSGTQLDYRLTKNAAFRYDQYAIRGETSALNRSLIQFQSGLLDMMYRREAVGNEFNELDSLTPYERARLGILKGLDRTDFSTALRLGPASSASYSTMAAKKDEEGTIRRQTFNFEKPGLKLGYKSRSVAEGFASLGQFHDPEYDLLQQLRGFNQSEYMLDWQMMKSLRFALSRSEAEQNGMSHESRLLESIYAGFNPDSKTTIEGWRYQNKSTIPEDLLFANASTRLRLSRDFGKFGQLAMERESINFDGKTTEEPDRTRTSASYETNLNSSTKVRTERTEVAFENGEKEEVKTHTLSTNISPRTGVSVSDTSVERTGDKPEERRRNYGFWYDFGRGVRFTYNYGRQTHSSILGQEQSDFQLSNGQVGGLTMGAQYQEQVWDRQRMNAVGNVQIATAKPLQWGSLRDLTFKYGADTQRDNGAFLRENRTMGAGFKVAGLQFGWDYLSQVGLDGVQAIDRTFRFATDQSETKPLRASLTYKLRTLPRDQEVMIRTYNFAARLTKDWTLTHSLVTNPEVANGGVILGSTTQASRQNRWKMDFNGSKAMKIGLSWDEFTNDQAKTRSRIGGVNLTLNPNNPSPVSLFYGVEQNDANSKRGTQHRYSLKFDQRPGPNQSLSLFVGNISWQHSRPKDSKLQNWTLRMEYNIRF